MAKYEPMSASPTDRGADFTATLLTARPHEQLSSRPDGVRLVVLEGPKVGAEFRIKAHQITVGRNALCDVVLEAASVSQRHVTLTLDSEFVRLRDLGSRNGTWIGQARVEHAQLHAGAEFYVGDCKLRLETIEVSEVAVYREHRFGSLLGTSEQMRAMFSALERLAPTPLGVLVLGETGTGKGEIARAIHAASGRSGKFVTIDCGTLPRELADALVLGHSRAAFTGATNHRQSPFEVAEGGTVFLDEVGELPLDLQPKLLRVVDRKEVQRVGETQVRPVDVRIIAATNRDLADDVAQGRFRLDLYQRLKPVSLWAPPLRERIEDIEPLAQEFLRRIATSIGRDLSLSAAALDALRGLSWDGNVRELKIAIERAAYLAPGPEITPRDLTEWSDLAPAVDGLPQLFGMPLKEASDGFHRLYLEHLLHVTGGDLNLAVERSGYTLRGLQTILKRLGIDRG